ncbi:peptide/nickel transport system permease protein [Paramicrobacterium humi]|uniref:Peptide/nickel transport system permease protein n=1 Tax=Paramicrobacterium humi TaxID=640635 RepID=A0A1H4LI26_9MICO|nr:ABC transporter permease [Microbacterium humi]SEB69905.1 peptide/nickel transport system permease protein [Microbacterium humi]
MTTLETAAPTVSAASRRRHPIGLYAALAVAAFFAIALAAPQLLATHGPFAISLTEALQPPGAAHWLGTDEQGRDLYSRIVFGARESLLIGIGATVVSITIALVLGSLAALGGRVVGAVVARIIEIQFAFPTLLLALLLVAIAGPSAISQVFAVAIGTAPGYARMIRAQILQAKRSGYVEAAIALGHPRGRVLARHILPNAVRPLVAVIAMSVGQSIVWASSLSFLGLGVAPPSPEWGALLDAGRLYIIHAPWLTVAPGLVIVVLAIASTTIGQHIQRALERGEK